MASFLDKIVVGVNKGVTTVGANSKALVEKAKINTAIGSLEKQRSQILQNLGQKIFDEHQKTGEIASDDVVANFISEINRCNATIAQQHEQIKLIDEEVKRATDAVVQASAERVPTQAISEGACSCGYVNPPNYKFCAGCGKVAEEDVEKTTIDNQLENAPTCVCGCVNLVGAKFCAECGSPL